MSNGSKSGLRPVNEVTQGFADFAREMKTILKMLGAFAAGLVAVAATAVAAPVEWTFPLRECHEGLPFADGRTGVLVWGEGDTLKITVGRADLWDHRGGYPWTREQSYTNIVAAVRSGDAARLKALFKKVTPKGEPRNPYMLPLGRVVVTVPGAELKSGALDPKTGIGTVDFVRAGKVHRAKLAMSPNSRTFAMKFPEGVAFTAKSNQAMDFPIAREALSAVGFKRADCFDDPAKGEGGFRWSLPADPAVWVAWTVRAGTLSLRTGRGDLTPGEGGVGSFENVSAESRAYWTAWWERSARVKVPDPVVQRVFDYGMYRFGAMTMPDGVPAGLQGPWLEDDRLVPWNGDYHFNINVQECYSPAYRGGHVENLLPLFRMVKSWWPILRDNAKKFCGVEDGFVLPHSVDDRGVCIGGFWSGTIDHASTAWVASMMFKYVRYSRDLAFLKTDAYPFMKGAMKVYLAMMEERDGRLSIPLGPSPEWGAADVRQCVGRDPSFQLAAAHRLARDLIAAAKLLGETPDPAWLDVESRLPAYTKGPGGFQLFEGQPFVESHRHHSHMAGLYPFDTIDVAAPGVKGDVAATYRTWVSKGTGLWSGWCVPWAAILNVHAGNAEAAVELLHAWEAFYVNPGHGSCHDAQRAGFSVMMGSKVMQMDGQCAAATAVLELMVHEVNGRTEYFRGCPAAWREVSFENVLQSDGTRVSGRRVDGRVEIATGAAQTIAPQIGLVRAAAAKK